MASTQKQAAVRSEFLIAALLIVCGSAVSGASLFQLARERTELAQATPPLRSTPGAETKPSVPTEPTPTGARPQEIAPQPARPDAAAVDAGAKPALPPAPAEKTGPPIPAK